MIFHPSGPNFFLSRMTAWKKQIPNISLRHVTPIAVNGEQKYGRRRRRRRRMRKCRSLFVSPAHSYFTLTMVFKEWSLHIGECSPQVGPDTYIIGKNIQVTLLP